MLKALQKLMGLKFLANTLVNQSRI